MTIPQPEDTQLTQHQKTTIKQTLKELTPHYNNPEREEYVDHIWITGPTINIRVNEVPTPQYEHLPLADIPNPEYVQPGENQTVIQFKSHGKKYLIFVNRAQGDKQ